MPASNKQSDSETTNDRDPNNIPVREVNIGCKVPEPWRRHWAAEAKRNGTTMTAVMIQALIDRFGKPEDDRSK